MNCNGVSCDPEELGRDDKKVTYACGFCAEMWEESTEDVNQGHEDDADYNDHPDFESCASCGGRGGYHRAACSEDDAIFY